MGAFDVRFESTGSKDMFFGAILFVLPILVTALQGFGDDF